MCSRIFGPAMAPSLVMWPMMMTGVPLSLANFSSMAAHSRIWLTEPGDDSTFSVAMVWMESMTTRSGATLSMCFITVSIIDSQATCTCDWLVSAMRSARSFS